MNIHPGFLIFRVRNYVFPVLYLTLFIPSFPIGNSVAMTVAGILFLGLGIWIRSVTIGQEYIVRGGKNRQIFAEGLVVGGIYETCRNPMYLGNLLILAGFGFLSNSLLFMVLIYPIFILIYVLIIKAEEAYLISKFGEMYALYRAETPSLIPKIRSMLSLTINRKLDVKRILRKEYNSWYLYLTGVLFLLLQRKSINTHIFFAALGCITLVWIIIKVCKKKGCLNTTWVGPV